MWDFLSKIDGSTLWISWVGWNMQNSWRTQLLQYYYNPILIQNPIFSWLTAKKVPEITTYFFITEYDKSFIIIHLSFRQLLTIIKLLSSEFGFPKNPGVVVQKKVHSQLHKIYL